MTTVLAKAPLQRLSTNEGSGSGFLASLIQAIGQAGPNASVSGILQRQFQVGG